MSLRTKLKRACVELFYPPFCLACETNTRGSLLCTLCAELMQPPLELPINRVTACYESCSVTLAFERHLRSQRVPHLAKTMGAMMALRLHELQWGPFDCIVPIPSRSYFHPKDHTYTLAVALGKWISCPIELGLQWNRRLVPQGKLPKDERENFPLDAFTRSPILEGQHVLIVDDTICSGGTMRAAAFAMQQPAYALSFSIYSQE